MSFDLFESSRSGNQPMRHAQNNYAPRKIVVLIYLSIKTYNCE